MLKITFPIASNSKTTAILIVLLAISIVANNFLGFCSNLNTFNKGFEFPDLASFKSVVDSENKATSAPDTIAEQTNKSTSAITSKVKEELNVINENNKLGGSISKSSGISLI